MPAAATSMTPQRGLEITADLGSIPNPDVTTLRDYFQPSGHHPPPRKISPPLRGPSAATRGAPGPRLAVSPHHLTWEDCPGVTPGASPRVGWGGCERSPKRPPRRTWPWSRYRWPTLPLVQRLERPHRLDDPQQPLLRAHRRTRQQLSVVPIRRRIVGDGCRLQST